MTMQTAELMPKETAAPATVEARFAEIMTAAKAQLEESKKIVVTDPTDVRGMDQSRTMRLAIRQIRIAGEKAHKELKEDVLRAGRAIDGMKNILLQLCEPEEARLMDQEKIAERIQKEREAKLRADRETVLVSLGENPAMHGPFETFAAADWDSRVADIKAAKEAREAAAKKAREEAEAKAKAEREEAERIRAENARLKAEADAKDAAIRAEREAAEKARREAEAKAKAERDAIEAKARAEREAAQSAICEANARTAAEAAKLAQERAKAEADAKARADAEAARIKAEEAAKRKAAAAPDKDKLNAYLAAIAAIPAPVMATEQGKTVAATVTEKIRAFGVWAANIIGGL